METIKVEQCDRDAAEHLADVGDNICNCEPCMELYAEHFAKHRIAERERNAGIVEKLSRKTGSELVGRAFMRAAQAIRAASDD